MTEHTTAHGLYYWDCPQCGSQVTETAPEGYVGPGYCRGEGGCGAEMDRVDRHGNKL